MLGLKVTAIAAPCGVGPHRAVSLPPELMCLESGLVMPLQHLNRLLLSAVVPSDHKEQAGPLQAAQAWKHGSRPRHYWKCLLRSSVVLKSFLLLNPASLGVNKDPLGAGAAG